MKFNYINMEWKYNTSFICTYKMGEEFDEDERNILYQIQLLDALNIRVNDIVKVDIDESILDDRINELYKNVINESLVIEAIEKNHFFENYKKDLLVIFKMLFSYDEFDMFHKILCNIFNNRN